MRGEINQPPLINLNRSRLIQQWLTRCYIVVSSDLFKLSRHHSARINKHDGTQTKDKQQDHGQAHRRDTPLNRIKA